MAEDIKQPDTEEVEGTEIPETPENTEPAAEEASPEPQPDKLAELNDKYLRLYSEYENYRKRTNLEKADLILNGGKDVIKSILPVIDDMERAIQHTADDTTRQGMELILNKLLSTLGAKGLKPMEANGEKFDEELHEAVTQFPAPSEELKGKVVDVVEKGYFLNEKVLRYAKVVVGI